MPQRSRAQKIGSSIFNKYMNGVHCFGCLGVRGIEKILTNDKEYIDIFHILALHSNWIRYAQTRRIFIYYSMDVFFTKRNPQVQHQYKVFEVSFGVPRMMSIFTLTFVEGNSFVHSAHLWGEGARNEISAFL